MAAIKVIKSIRLDSKGVRVKDRCKWEYCAIT